MQQRSKARQLAHDARNAIDALSITERYELRAICLLFDLNLCDFTVHVEREDRNGNVRPGRRFITVLYEPSGRYRTYRARNGSNWISAFGEDIRAHCFTSLLASMRGNQVQ